MAYTTINKSTDHFNTLTYSGTGGNGTTTTQAITGAGFQPDWVWLKQRTGTQAHQICDVLRGANNIISSSSTDAQVADTEIINSFDSDGFTAGYQDQANDTGQTYVSWLWKAGGAGSSNTDGSINTTSTSVNTTAGFSISQYTGTSSAGTIGHGLGVAPKMVIVKSLSNTTAWMVYHASLGNAQEIYLNGTNASSASTAWNSTTPTSTVVSLGGGSGDGVNYSGNYVAYCFAEKTGFSKFGSYTGNTSTDGTFVYCGFKPAFLIQKRSDTTSNWNLYDNKRSTSGGSNVIDDLFYVDANNAEVSHTSVDFLSNGFKFRSSDGAINTGPNIYMAFAEAPLVGTNNVPATAR